MPKTNRILVIRNDKLGDVILATPVFLSLRSAFPKSYIAALVSAAGYGAVKDNPYLNTVIVDDIKGKHAGKTGFLRLAEKIRAEKFDAVLVLFSNWRMGRLCYQAGIPTRIGAASKIAQIFYTKRIYQHRSACLRHEAEYNLELAAVLGAEPILKTQVYTGAEVKKQAALFFDSLKLDAKRPLIGIHPGSGGSAVSWPLDKYIELANLLTTELGAGIFITHGPGEEDKVQYIAKKLNKPPYYYHGNYSIQFMAELIKRFKVFVSSNTGPMHLAAAVGTPCVSLFSPLIATNATRWGPIGNKNKALTPALPECRKCIPDKCIHFNCLDLISAKQVAQAVGKAACPPMLLT